MAAHTHTDTKSDLLPGLAVMIPPTVTVKAETPDAHCNLLTMSDHLFTAGVGLIFYVSILWLAFKLKKLVGRHLELQTKHLAHYDLNVVDHFFGICLWITLLGTIYLRLERGEYVVLVLPCHYLTSLLLAVVYCKKKDHPIFMIYLYAHWQGYYAILFADMTWYVSYVEVVFFWAQHILLAIVPLYYLFCTDRFRNLPNSFFDFITIYAWTQVYHGLVIIPGAFIWTQDLNSMLCRPAGLEITGTWWREVVSLSSMVSAFFMTYIPKALADVWHSYGIKGKQA